MPHLSMSCCEYMVVWCRLLSDDTGANRMKVIWQKHGSQRFYPKALEQRHILIPVHLGTTVDNLAGTHWGLLVFTHLQIRPHAMKLLSCSMCVRMYGHLNAWD